MNRENWHYPVIWDNGSGEFWRIDDDAMFHRGTKDMARDWHNWGPYDWKFYDANLGFWKITDVQLRRPISRSSEWKKVWPLLQFRKDWVVEFKTEFLGCVTVEELKSNLLSSIRENDMISDEERAVEQNRISAASTIGELFAVLEIH